MAPEINQYAISFNRNVKSYYAEILTDEALDFIKALHDRFNSKRLELLQARAKQQQLFDQGEKPSFPTETKAIREGNWVAGEIPHDLQDRRVEITGPTDRKMVINALNSGARTFMADLEDSTAPSWQNVIEGQINLRDAVNKTITYHHPTKDKKYTLNNEVATLLVRPRGWHLNEKHLLIDNVEVSGSLVDFGLYFFTNVSQLLKNNTAPYFYLAKLEHYLEARLWNEVFEFAQEYLELPVGTIKCTVLIETITASHQLDEIIYELKDHIVGLNCGRWDYIFSYIKKFRNDPDFLVPNRDQVGMTAPFMDAYSKLVIQRCHKRKILAIGGMAAQVPIKDDVKANNAALEKVRKDKEREVKNGHDGTWVAHPALVQVALDEFNTHMPTPNQMEVTRDDVTVTASDLIAIPEGTITEEGVRKNINVGILYLNSWLSGQGAVALYHLMEDAATAEISRTQIWHWLKNKAVLDDGNAFTKELYVRLFDEEVEKIITQVGADKLKDTQFENAFNLFNDLVLAQDFEEFLTTPAYAYL